MEKEKVTISFNTEPSSDDDSSNSTSSENSNCIREIEQDDDSIEDVTSFILHTQVAHVVASPSPEKKQSAIDLSKDNDDFLDLAISLKHGDEKLFTDDDCKMINESSRLAPTYTKSIDSLEKRFLTPLKNLALLKCKPFSNLYSMDYQPRVNFTLRAEVINMQKSTS